MNGRVDCPEGEAVHAVLDRVAPAAIDASVRAHVAECDECLARHGAAFELELWAPALIAPNTTTTAAPAEPRSASRVVERIAVAAALIALAWFGARIPAEREAAPLGAADAELASDGRVLALELCESTIGPDGSVVVRRIFDPDGARRGGAALVKVEEVRTSRDGVATVHERFLPQDAADRE